MEKNIEVTLARLREEFISRLPDRIDALKSLLEAVSRGDVESHEILHRTAHSLVGAAGVHRLLRVSEVARVLERIASTLPADAAADEAVLAAMRDALDNLMIQAAQPVQLVVPPPAIRPSTRRIFVVDDNEDQTSWLRSVLEQAGYQVDVFNNLAAFSAACQGENLPAAIIMDMIFPEGKEAGARIIADLKKRSLNGLPVIFISERRDIAAKLAAYRAGASRYLNKPVKREMLLQVVGESAALMPAIPYRVLVVDDDAEQVSAYALMLRQAGMNVREVSDPLLVPDILSEFDAEVLLLDMYMPQCSGPELAAILRDDEQHADTPIVYLSSETDVSLQLLALDRGGDHFLSKPASQAHLVSVVGLHARRARQESELAESMRTTLYERERQQQALDVHAIVSATNVRGEIFYVNDRFCEVSGYSREELLGKNHRIVKSGEHPAELYADIWHTISGGKIWQGEVCNRSKDGSLYWVETSIVPFVDVHGLPYQYISIRTEITKLKNAAERVRLSEQRMNQAQQLAHLGSFEWNPVNGDLYWSDEHYSLWGLQPGSVVPTFELFRQNIYPDDLVKLDQSLERAMKREGDFDCVYRLKHAKGSERIMHSRGEFSFDEKGKPLKLTGTVQDITARKITEKALAESRARLEEAQTQAHLGNWEADLASGELHWSDEIYRIFGQDREHFAPSVEAFRQAIHPEDIQLVEESERRATETGIHDVVHRIIRTDGAVRYVHELARSQFDGQGKLVRLRGTVQDVTDLKQAEQAMMEAKIAAEEANRAKSEFLANMSHELRTPLNAILGFSQLFGMDTRLPPETRNNAREIERAGEHLLSLVNDIIDLSRIETGRLDLSLEPVDLRASIKESLSLVTQLAQEKQVGLVEQEHDARDTLVLADHLRLRQVLINLLTNAIKYNKPQGSVHLNCALREGFVRLSVVDNGPGIPADKQARVFHAFDRLGEERGLIEGTGIGLVITKRLVESMGGTIGFESTPGQGSCFWVELPVVAGTLRSAPVAHGQASVVTPVAEESTTHTARPVVLYIEDNAMNLRLMQKIFESRKNLELRDAVSAEIGINMARANPPALILMDINLPGMDGYAAQKILSADPRTAGVPIIALTANAMKGDQERGRESGFVNYLTKPLDVVRFLGILDHYFKA